MTSGNSPFSWVQPSTTHFWPLSFSRTTAVVCGSDPISRPRDSGASIT